MVNHLDQVSVVVPVVNDRSALDALLRMLSPFQELEIVVVDGGSDDVSIDEDDPAVILYTSGTTSRPKGAVTTHANIAAQIVSLVDAWQWTHHDHIIQVLPLHHIHGIVNVLGCGLWSGAVCEMMPGFDAEVVWQRIAGACG